MSHEQIIEESFEEAMKADGPEVDLDELKRRNSVKYECRYGGRHWGHTVASAGNRMTAWVLCGERGWLCDRCREDRADTRMESLVLAITRLEHAVDDASAIRR